MYIYVFIRIKTMSYRQDVQPPHILNSAVLIVRLPFSKQFIKLKKTMIHPKNNTVITLIVQQKYSVSKGRYVPLNNMIDYASWLIILLNMKDFGPTSPEELHSKSEAVTDERKDRKKNKQKTYLPHTIVFGAYKRYHRVSRWTDITIAKRTNNNRQYTTQI